MAITVDQITGLLQTTQKDLGEGKITDLSSTIQEYYAMPMLMNDKRSTIDAGTSIQRTINRGITGSAVWKGLYAEDSVNVRDNIALLDVPWRHATTNYGFDVLEPEMNKGKRRIFDLIKLRRHNAMVNLAQLFETGFWGKPADSTDVLTMWGIDMWLVPSATAVTTNNGFNGGNPAGFSTLAGLDTSTEANKNFRNYTDIYTTVSKEDAITKMRTAYRKTYFKAPVPGLPSYDKSGGNREGMRCQIYTNEANVTAFEKIGEAQNENLGRDIAAYNATGSGGGITFRGCLINWVPELDDDTRNPIYMVNWDAFGFVALEGAWMQEYPPQRAANQHTVVEVFKDCTLNTLCTDRRKQALLVTSV